MRKMKNKATQVLCFLMITLLLIPMGGVLSAKEIQSNLSSSATVMGSSFESAATPEILETFTFDAFTMFTPDPALNEALEVYTFDAASKSALAPISLDIRESYIYDDTSISALESAALDVLDNYSFDPISASALEPVYEEFDKFNGLDSGSESTERTSDTGGGTRGLVTIAYSGNQNTSGTVPTSHSLNTPGSTATKLQGNLAKTGHAFIGWRLPDGSVIAAGGTLQFTTAQAGTLTLQAHWVPSTVTIQYNGNQHTSGSVPTSHSLTTPGSITTKLQGTLAKTGNAFVGWKLPDGTVIAAGGTLQFTTAQAGTLTLQAHWVPSTVTIQYNGNQHTSGSVPTSHSLTTPGSITTKLQGTLAKTGNVFVGWKLPDGTVIAAGGTLQFTTAQAGTLTLQAHWVPSIVTIQYSGNGHTSGTVPGNQTITTPGSIAVQLQGNLAKTNNGFTGWKLPDGSILAAGGALQFTTAQAGTVTLSANWNPIVTIQYNGNGHTTGTVPLSHIAYSPGVTTLAQQGLMKKANHAFCGWLDPTGTIVYQPGQVIPVTGQGTITYTANWIPNLLGRWLTFSTITFEAHIDFTFGEMNSLNTALTTWNNEIGRNMLLVSANRHSALWVNGANSNGLNQIYSEKLGANMPPAMMRPFIHPTNTINGLPELGETDIVINRDFDWSTISSNKTLCISTGFMHETGHALGIGHVDGQSNIMYWLIGLGEQKTTLTNTDKVLLNTLNY